MRVSQAEKERSHRRIVDGAARLVRERGVDTTSVADVMSDAGLTNGGFYRHFDTKEALMEAAITAAFDQAVAGMEDRLTALGAESGLKGYQSFYLSDGHVKSPGVGCPIAALGGDIARAPDGLKAAYGAGVNRTIATLAKAMHGTDQKRRAGAARKLAMLAGAVVIARASDPETGRAVLEACRL